LSGSSRLAFRMPGNRSSLPFNLQGLLSWAGLVPSVVPAATSPLQLLTPQVVQLAPPSANQTAIEIPWRLVLSTNPWSRWEHEVDVKRHADVAELWHTRLADEEQVVTSLLGVQRG